MSAQIFISGLLAVLAGTDAIAGKTGEIALYAKLAKALSSKGSWQVVDLQEGT
jgi:hypothetical protein